MIARKEILTATEGEAPHRQHQPPLRTPRPGIPVKCWLALLLGALLVCSCAPLKELAEAEKLRSGSLQGKIQALNLCESALSKASSSTQKRQVEATMESIRADIAGEVLKESEAARGAVPTVPSVSKAQELVQRYLQYDDAAKRLHKAQEDLKQTLANLKSSCQQNLELAKKAEAGYEWSRALTALTNAAQLDPSAVSLDAERARVLQARDKHYQQGLAAALKQENLDEAGRLLKEFLAQVPPPDAAQVASIRKDTEATCDKIATRQIEAAIQAKKYYTAFKLLDHVYDRNAVPNCANLIDQGAAFYLAKAREEMAASNRLGYAYLAAVKAMEMKPSDATIFGLHRDYSDAINRLTQVKIAISSFDSPAKEPDAGKAFSGALIAKLGERLPFGIEIKERSKIDEMLRERGSQLQELSEELKVEMFIVGNVSALEVDHQRSESMTQVSVPTGVRKEANPAYTQMMMQYGPNVRKWPSVPPSTIDSPINETMSYKSGQERVSGLMLVTARIFDTAKGGITGGDEFKATEVAEDKFSDALPAAKIQADPLVLPSDIEIREKMRMALVKQVADLIIKAYEYRERRFWNSAEWLLGRQEMDKAVLELARGYYYCLMDKPNLEGQENNPYFKKIAEAGLVKYTE
jgi:hypothetical protein